MTVPGFDAPITPDHPCSHAWALHDDDGRCGYPKCRCGQDPPIVGRADPANSHIAAALVEPSRGSKRAAVLDLLRQSGWVSAERLREVGGGQGDRRMRELRQMGYKIEARPTGSGTSWEYRLTP